MKRPRSPCPLLQLMVQEEGARCLPVLALLALSRKRGVGPLGFCWKPGSPAGTSWDASEPLPGSGELSESMFLTRLFFCRRRRKFLYRNGNAPFLPSY